MVIAKITSGSVETPAGIDKGFYKNALEAFHQLNVAYEKGEPEDKTATAWLGEQFTTLERNRSAFSDLENEVLLGEKEMMAAVAVVIFDRNGVQPLDETSRRNVLKKYRKAKLKVAQLLKVDDNLSASTDDIAKNMEILQLANQGNKSIEQGNKSTRVPIIVDGELVRRFIKDMESLGLQKTNPDELFFEHLQAPGFSIQLAGKNPDEMTGAMIDLSYESRNFSMGRGTIAGLIGILLEKEKSSEAIEWLNKQFVEAEINIRQRIQPQESKLEIEDIAIGFIPPTSLDKFNATVLIYKSENQSELKFATPNEINATNEFGVIELARKAGEGDLESVKKLLANGADPNLSTGDGEPPLLCAVRTSRDQVVKILLEAGANPNYKSKEGVTPLQIAKGQGANVTIQHLLEYGATE